MRVGITGHQRLARPGGWGWVSTQIDLVLSQTTKPLVGVTCLAIGADQLFAERVLYHGGALCVVVPFEGYEASFHSASDRDAYLRLVSIASYKKLLRGCGSAEQSYMKAGKMVVDLSDLVLAVWDGEPAAGLGGTADVVEFAIERGKPLIHLNPVLETTQRHPA
jgi:hypothetical protein